MNIYGRAKIGLFFIIVGFVFSIIETVYFGNNFLPIPNEEIASDIFCYLLFLIGLYLICTPNKNKAKHNF